MRHLFAPRLLRVGVALAEPPQAGHGRADAVKVPGAEAMVMIRIDAAGKSFQMGSPEHEKDHRPDETQHEVAFTYDWDMAKFTVTVGQIQGLCERFRLQDGS